jgi:hypothetical protein
VFVQLATTMIADYDSFLATLQLVDKRDALADCGLDDGLELVQLQQMDTADLCKRPERAIARRSELGGVATQEVRGL